MERSWDVETDERADRLTVHFAWEALLVLAGAGAAWLVYNRSSEALSGSALRSLAVTLAIGVLLAASAAVSLRATVPNLAVGSTAVGAGVAVGWLTTRHDVALSMAAGAAAVGAVGVGVLLAVVVLALRAPGWAASLMAAGLLAAGSTALIGTGTITVPDAPDLQRWAWQLLAAAAAVSALGGAVALTPSTRRWLGGHRTEGDPASGRSGSTKLAVILALVASSLLAATAGVLAAFQAGSVPPAEGTASLWTFGAFAAALLGGVSVHGRRGGLAGTALATVLIGLVLRWLALDDAEPWLTAVTLGVAGLVGLAASRLVEQRAVPAELDDEPTGLFGDSGYPERDTAETSYLPRRYLPPSGPEDRQPEPAQRQPNLADTARATSFTGSSYLSSRYAETRHTTGPSQPGHPDRS